MNGYGSHTFKLVSKEGQAVYCKFHYKTDQKIDCFFQAEADKVASSNPDYGIQVWNAARPCYFQGWRQEFSSRGQLPAGGLVMPKFKKYSILMGIRNTIDRILPGGALPLGTKGFQAPLPPPPWLPG